MEYPVVGTSYANNPDIALFKGDFDTVDDVERVTCQCLLIPQPFFPEAGSTAEPDPNAVAVYAPLATGEAKQVGWLAKGSDLQKQIKEKTLCQLHILAYSHLGQYNDKYILEV
jgi:hypothetical protein